MALRIEQIQRQARATCARYGAGSLECAQAWQQANQAIEAITRETASQPQTMNKPSSFFLGISWWHLIQIWIQNKVRKLVYNPPFWLSISSQGQPFELKDLFVDEIIYPQFSARNGFETWVYQNLTINLEMTTKFTSNPSGWIDFNFSNGRITFKGAKSQMALA